MAPVFVIIVAIATLIIVMQASRLRHFQIQVKGYEARISKIKSAALNEIERVRGNATSRVRAAEESRRAIQEDCLKREQALFSQLVDVSSRPPTILPAPVPVQPDMASLIQAVGESVAKVAYGPQRPAMTEQEVIQSTYDLTRNLDATNLGAPSGDWMPDVEMDEWMEEYGVPNKPGWIAGTAPPTMQASPDSVTDEMHMDLLTTMAQAPRHNGDRAVFASGQSGPRPQGGVE